MQGAVHGRAGCYIAFYIWRYVILHLASSTSADPETVPDPAWDNPDSDPELGPGLGRRLRERGGRVDHSCARSLWWWLLQRVVLGACHLLVLGINLLIKIYWLGLESISAGSTDMPAGLHALSIALRMLSDKSAEVFYFVLPTERYSLRAPSWLRPGHVFPLFFSELCFSKKNRRAEFILKKLLGPAKIVSAH